MSKLEDELKDARNKAEDADKQYDEVSGVKESISTLQQLPC